MTGQLVQFPLLDYDGLSGDYGSPPSWGAWDLTCKLVTYVVTERHITFNRDKNDVIWDAGAITRSLYCVNAVGAEAQRYCGDHFLLILRHPADRWDNHDPDVFVYGIKRGEKLGEEPLARSFWQPRTVWLAGASTMIVNDPRFGSEISLLLEEREKPKRTANHTP